MHALWHDAQLINKTLIVGSKQTNDEYGPLVNKLASL